MGLFDLVEGVWSSGESAVGLTVQVVAEAGLSVHRKTEILLDFRPLMHPVKKKATLFYPSFDPRCRMRGSIIHARLEIESIVKSHLRCSYDGALLASRFGPGANQRQRPKVVFRIDAQPLGQDEYS
jgi:hypothetical protein